MNDITLDAEQPQDTPCFFSVKNPVYLANGDIDCEVQPYEEADYLPFTASANDPEPRRQQFFAELVAGKYGDITPWVETPEMLSSAKQNKMDEISAWRDAQENGNIYFKDNGHRWDASKASQSRLAPVVAVASAGLLPPGFFWTDADNMDVPMNAEKLKALELSMQSAMVMQGFKIHERQRQMKEDISQLTSLDEIRNYPVGW